jgi:hypothetical protein
MWILFLWDVDRFDAVEIEDSRDSFVAFEKSFASIVVICWMSYCQRQLRKLVVRLFSSRISHRDALDQICPGIS